MVFGNWRCVVVTTTIGVLGSSMIGCVHRVGSPASKSTAATRQVDRSTSWPRGPRGEENTARVQENIDETLKRLKQRAGARPSPPVPASMTRPDAEPQQPPGTARTDPPRYGVVVLTYPTPESENRTATAPSVAPNNAVGLDRGAGRLRPRTAPLIAVALVAAMVWLPRLRHRGQSFQRQRT
jgi:hypothetical protein